MILSWLDVILALLAWCVVSVVTAPIVGLWLRRRGWQR